MVRAITASVITLLLVLGLAAEAKESPMEVAGATTVDAAAAKTLFDRGIPFVDVRGNKQWRIGHIPGALVLDLITGLSEASLMKVAKKNDEVVLYCGGPG